MTRKGIIILFCFTSLAFAIDAPIDPEPITDAARPTPTPSSIPDAPSALTATLNPNNSATEVDLSWTDNSDNEKEFRVARSPTGTGFVRIATLPPNTITYTDMGLSPGSTYYYQVNASNAAGTSRQSNTVKVTTASPTASPTPPTPTPSPKPTPSPTASPTPKPSPSPTPTPSPTATPTPRPTPTPTLTPSPSPSPTPTPTATPAQTRTVTVEIVNPTKGDRYQIYFGVAPNQYGTAVAMLDGAISCGIPDLKVGSVYYFANTVTRNGVNSVMSAPVSYTVTAATTQELRLGNEPQ